MVSDNGRLHGVQAVAHGADAFNCGDALAIDGAQGHQARVRWRVLEQHRAGAAAPLATAQLEPLQVEIGAQILAQRSAGIRVRHFHWLAIDVKAQRVRMRRPWHRTTSLNRLDKNWL